MDCCGKIVSTPFCPNCGKKGEDDISKIKIFLIAHIENKIRGCKSQLKVAKRKLEEYKSCGTNIERRLKKFEKSVFDINENLMLVEKSKIIVSEL